MTVEYLILASIGLLVSVTAFFLRQLVFKFERIEVSINMLNEKIAVIMAHQEHHQADMEQRVLFEKRVDKEIKDMRNRIHEVINNQSGLSLRIDMIKEGCPKTRGEICS